MVPVKRCALWLQQCRGTLLRSLVVWGSTCIAASYYGAPIWPMILFSQKTLALPSFEVRYARMAPQTHFCGVTTVVATTCNWNTMPPIFPRPLPIDTDLAQSLVGLKMSVPTSWWQGCDGDDLNQGAIAADELFFCVETLYLGVPSVRYRKCSFFYFHFLAR